jgi:RNase P subunit RPR2
VKHEVAVKREAPSLYCHQCRTWVESQEKVNLFASVDGARKHVGVWTCPPCRGETGPAAVVTSARAPKTQADVSKDERLGPYRSVQPGTAVLSASGKSSRVVLECGHKVSVLPSMDRARCRKCRGKSC